MAKIEIKIECGEKFFVSTIENGRQENKSNMDKESLMVSLIVAQKTLEDALNDLEKGE